MKSDLQTILHTAGVSPHYCGYRYLQDAVFLAVEDPCRLHNIQKEIYFPVAQRHKTTIDNVEKDIRTVRDILMKRGGNRILAELTGYTPFLERKPFPKELIGLLAEYLKTDKED